MKRLIFAAFALFAFAHATHAQEYGPWPYNYYGPRYIQRYRYVTPDRYVRRSYCTMHPNDYYCRR